MNSLKWSGVIHLAICGLLTIFLFSSVLFIQPSYGESVRGEDRSFSFSLLSDDLSGDISPYSDVLLVVNDNSSDSVTIGEHFALVRSIPSSNVVHIDCTTNETINNSVFFNDVMSPIKAFYNSMESKEKINYVVTTKGVPLRVNRSIYNEFGMGWRYNSSVDSDLTCAFDLSLHKYINHTPPDFSYDSYYSPYFEKNYSFASVLFSKDIKLVTRLTAYNTSTVLEMINRTSKENLTIEGKFVHDIDPLMYVTQNYWMNLSKDWLIENDYTVVYDDTEWYVVNQTDVMGYISWGSNDHNDTNNGKPNNTWVNGSIAETLVSTSGRSFTWPPTYGQSMIADLIDEGCTGVKGYVFEPYASSTARPQILFNRYVQGYNLAESYYMASPKLAWMDMVVGDPKSSPYGDPHDLEIHNFTTEKIQENQYRFYLNVSSIKACSTNVTIKCDHIFIENISVDFNATEVREIQFDITGVYNGVGSICATVDYDNQIDERLEIDNSLSIDFGTYYGPLPPPYIVYVDDPPVVPELFDIGSINMIAIAAVMVIIPIIVVKWLGNGFRRDFL